MAAGKEFILERVVNGPLDLVILDNFSTLGEVEDENAASSFNAIQQFLLQLKVQGVATMLLHHAGKSGDFRGSSKLAATFETIIRLELLKEEIEHGAAQFRVRWDKVRAGGPKRKVREVVARLVTSEPSEAGGAQTTVWEYEAEQLGRLDELKTRLEAAEFGTTDCSEGLGRAPRTEPHKRLTEVTQRLTPAPRKGAPRPRANPPKREHHRRKSKEAQASAGRSADGTQAVQSRRCSGKLNNQRL